MAAKRRHWHEKDGRFWARIAIPEKLQKLFGKTQLTEPPGGDLRAADRAHAGAVARLQNLIREAQAQHDSSQTSSPPQVIQTAFTAEHAEWAVWDHYSQILRNDEAKRTAMPTTAEVDAEQERLFQRFKAGQIEQTSIAQINAATDLELMITARVHDANIRVRCLRRRPPRMMHWQSLDKTAPIVNLVWFNPGNPAFVMQDLPFVQRPYRRPATCVIVE